MISLRPSQMIGKMQLTSLHRNGEALTTKATIFLCNAPLQDIIFRFMERKDEDSWQWSEFPRFGWNEAREVTSGKSSICPWWTNSKHIQTLFVCPAKRPIDAEFWNCYGISRAFNGDTDLLPVSLKGVFVKQDNSNSSWGMLQYREFRKTEE